MFVEGFGGCLPAEGLPWPAIQRRGSRIQVASRVPAEVGALREVSAEQTIGVLVGPTLPRGVRVAEVDVEVGIDPQLGMSGQLGALVPGQGTDGAARAGS